jgi:hypothetical protein
MVDRQDLDVGPAPLLAMLRNRLAVITVPTASESASTRP